MPCVLFSVAALTANKLGHLSAGLCGWKGWVPRRVVFHRSSLLSIANALSTSDPLASGRAWWLTYFPKITMKLALLFSTSVSPGTGVTATVTREAASSVTPLTVTLAL
jgi:hypothetical protein